MLCNEIAYLCREIIEFDQYRNEVKVFESRMIFVREKSVGAKEFYVAGTVDLKPDIILEMTDYSEYDGEKILQYNGKMYDIIRQYRKGRRLELTLTERCGVNGRY